MSIHFPQSDWFQAPRGGERLWIGLALGWCVVLTVMMPYWHFRGQQNSTGEAYRVVPKDFYDRTTKFVEANKVGEEAGTPVVQPAPGTDIYLVAQMWRFYPLLKLKKNATYRLHISSMDLNHGFSLQPMNMNFQILPGYDHVLTITPTSSGTFPLFCNEFCGIGHHLMAAKIIVED